MATLLIHKPSSSWAVQVTAHLHEGTGAGPSLLLLGCKMPAHPPPRPPSVLQGWGLCAHFVQDL